MKAVQNGSDRSDCTASPLRYEEMFSILMYYGHMSKYDILHSSRNFLVSIYQQYVNRACENLGVSADGDSEDPNRKNKLTEDDYPSEFVSFSQAQREKLIEESGLSDSEFISQFDAIAKKRY